MEENLNTESAEQLEQLIPKKNDMSVVWTHFCFSEDDTDQKIWEMQTLWKKTVSATKDNLPTPNLFQHLEINHFTEHEQCMAQKKRLTSAQQQP